MKKKFTNKIFTALLLMNIMTLAAQPSDKAYFMESKPGFYQNSILRDAREVEARQTPMVNDKFFRLDIKGRDIPCQVDLYKNQVWHFPPISQGNTGTCWCFSTTSFYESEIYRQTGKQIKLSEIYTVYWEYVEKATRYVQERGNSLVDEGSEGNAVARIWKKYGIVPETAYNGLPEGRKFYNHEKMVAEMKSYLESVKASNTWNKDLVISTIKDILNHYMGKPPVSFQYNNKEQTPQEFLAKVLKINLDDYVDFMSLLQEPFYSKAEYKVPDNWWHSKDYYNVPLNDFIFAITNAIKNGYSIAIGGDVSEAGFDRATQSALIPDFDIPSSYINDNARQLRFSNHTSTDDHGMHLVGYLLKDGKYWFLIKDSSAGSRNNGEDKKEFGYYFFHEDFVKLKMLSFCVHKDAVKELLAKFTN
jgi:bleomycin hydrolase